jgi:asparagine synthase (glutamine-hydrolysing)
MCGLAGFLKSDGINNDEAAHVLRLMTDRLAHRGPDDTGYWQDNASGIAMGHRRLSIIDLSSAGHQPMVSASGRYVIVFNGEIYNHREIRQQLGKSNWKGFSDTETILAAVEEWGLEKTLKKSVGMFVIALWDCSENTLQLARDRMGEKPLYYGWQGNFFIFASEIKALQRHPSFEWVINREALQLYVRNGYVPANLSIYSGIHKLKPGKILTVQRNMIKGEVGEPKSYWCLDKVIERGKANYKLISPEESVEELERLLKQAVNRQLISDVPLGAFLSGGTDSSLVVALMQSLSDKPVKTFTIGYIEDAYNEAHHARKVAEYLKTDHTEFFVTPKQAMDMVPLMAGMYDEPFADSSQLPTALVCKLAHQQVTVALSGDGGDELFCGYDRYPNTISIWNKLSKIPLPIRRTIAGILPFHYLSDGLTASTPDELYFYLNSQWKGSPGLINGLSFKNEERILMETVLKNPMERFMYYDINKYLPDDILVKVDRAAMGTSLETRVPLLDQDVIEYAWSLPMSIKYNNNITKWPLKQLLYKYVPKSLLDRPKMGFGVPVAEWLRGPLKEWTNELLSKERIEADGFFDSKLIQNHWQQHLSGKKNRSYGLWAIIMFQAWYEKNKTIDKNLF